MCCGGDIDGGCGITCVHVCCVIVIDVVVVCALFCVVSCCVVGVSCCIVGMYHDTYADGVDIVDVLNDHDVCDPWCVVVHVAYVVDIMSVVITLLNVQRVTSVRVLLILAALFFMLILSIRVTVMLTVDMVIWLLSLVYAWWVVLLFVACRMVLLALLVCVVYCCVAVVDQYPRVFGEYLGIVAAVNVGVAAVVDICDVVVLWMLCC